MQATLVTDEFNYTNRDNVVSKNWNVEFRTMATFINEILEPSIKTGGIGERKHPTLISYFNMQIKKETRQLRISSRRPRYGNNYCSLVSLNNCTTNNGIISCSLNNQKEKASYFLNTNSVLNVRQLLDFNIMFEDIITLNQAKSTWIFGDETISINSMFKNAAASNNAILQAVTADQMKLCNFTSMFNFQTIGSSEIQWILICRFDIILLEFSKKMLTRPIPQSIKKTKMLENLFSYSHDFTGTILSELRLINLSQLSLTYNKLRETIPTLQTNGSRLLHLQLPTIYKGSLISSILQVKSKFPVTKGGKKDREYSVLQELIFIALFLLYTSKINLEFTQEVQEYSTVKIDNLIDENKCVLGRKKILGFTSSSISNVDFQGIFEIQRQNPPLLVSFFSSSEPTNLTQSFRTILLSYHHSDSYLILSLIPKLSPLITLSISLSIQLDLSKLKHDSLEDNEDFPTYDNTQHVVSNQISLHKPCDDSDQLSEKEKVVEMLLLKFELLRLSAKCIIKNRTWLKVHLVSVVATITALSNGSSSNTLCMEYFWILDRLESDLPWKQRLLAHSSLPRTALDYSKSVSYKNIQDLLQKGVFSKDHFSSSELTNTERNYNFSVEVDISTINAIFWNVYINRNPCKEILESMLLNEIINSQERQMIIPFDQTKIEEIFLKPSKTIIIALKFKFPQPGATEEIKRKEKWLEKMTNCTFTYLLNVTPTPSLASTATHSLNVNQKNIATESNNPPETTSKSTFASGILSLIHFSEPRQTPPFFESSSVLTVKPSNALLIQPSKNPITNTSHS